MLFVIIVFLLTRSLSLSPLALNIMHSVLEPIHILPYTFFFHPIRLYVRSCSRSYSNCLHCWRTFSALSFVLIVVLHGITRHGKSSENKQTNKRKNISKQHEYNRPSTDVHCTLYNVVMCMIFHVLILATTLTTTINVANNLQPKPFYIAYGEKRAPKKNVRENCLGKRYQYITHMMSFLYHYQTSFNLRVSATLPCSLHLFRYQTG